MSDGHSLILPFTSDDPQFTLGYEIGRLFTVLRSTEDAFDCELHAANAEMILRCAEAAGRTVRTEELGAGWVTAYFGEASQ